MSFISPGFATRLHHCTKGSVATIFGLMVMPFIGFVGMSVDMQAGYNTKNELQRALDAAVLAASNPTVEDAQRQIVFTNMLTQNLANTKIKPTAQYNFTAEAGGVGTATFAMPTSFLPVIGYDTFEIATTSQARFDEISLEVALAIDISGSMRNSGKMDAVQVAASNMIQDISNSASASNQPKFGLVPFNMAVNIGTDRGHLVEGANNPLFAGTSWGGCVLERPNDFHHQDVFNPGALDGSGRWPAYVWPPEPNSSNQCTNPSNGTNTGYASQEQWPLSLPVLTGGPNMNCPRHSIVDLSTNTQALTRSINDLTAEYNHGTTFGPAVSWAMRMLTPSRPLDNGAAYSSTVKKFIVVLTDGDQVIDGRQCSTETNTTSPYRFDPRDVGLDGNALNRAPATASFTPYGYLQDSDPYNQRINSSSDANLELDRLTLEACTEAKSQGANGNGIEIYSIAVGGAAGPGTRAFRTLQACASSPGNMFHAADASEISKVFKTITERINVLRLTN